MWLWIAAEFFWSISVIVHSEEGNYCRLIIFNRGLHYFFLIAQMVTLDNPKSTMMMLLQVNILKWGFNGEADFFVGVYTFGAFYEFEQCV